MTDPVWRVPSSIDAMALTTASWVTLTQIGLRMAADYSELEIARELGVRRRDVVEDLDSLRAELGEQARADARKLTKG